MEKPYICLVSQPPFRPGANLIRAPAPNASPQAVRRDCLILNPAALGRARHPNYARDTLIGCYLRIAARGRQQI